MSKLPLIKRILLSIVLGVETYLVGTVLRDFVRNQNYFSLSINFTLKIVILLILILYTLALAVSTSEKWLYQLIFGIGISLGVFFNLIIYDTLYAVLISLGSLLITMLNSLRSLKFKKNLLKIIPTLSLRSSTKGILLIFGVLVATIFLLESTGSTNDFNIGKKIAEVTKKPIEGIIENSIPNLQTPQMQVEEKDIPQVTNVQNLLTQTLFSPEIIDVHKIIETNVNNLLEPYKRLISPLMAVLIFAIFQFYASISYNIYLLTITPLFALLKKIGLIHVEKILVEKEQLSL